MPVALAAVQYLFSAMAVLSDTRLMAVRPLRFRAHLRRHLMHDKAVRLRAEVQRRTAQAIGEGRDCIVTAETGSGKTLAFLIPTLARLTYPDGASDDGTMEARPV